MPKVLPVSDEKEWKCDVAGDATGYGETYGYESGDGSAIEDATNGYGNGSPPEGMPPRGDGFSDGDGYGLGTGDGLSG